MKLKAIVQGEVIVKEIKKLPENLPSENKDGGIAYGETGGLHHLSGGKFKLYGDLLATQKYLEVIETTELRHNDNGENRGHEVAILDPGVYEIHPQNEIDIIEHRVRTVLD